MNAGNLITFAIIVLAVQGSACRAQDIAPQASYYVQFAVAASEVELLMRKSGGAGLSPLTTEQIRLELTALEKIPNVHGNFYYKWLQEEKVRLSATKEKLLKSGLGPKHPYVAPLDSTISAVEAMLKREKERR